MSCVKSDKHILVQTDKSLLSRLNKTQEALDGIAEKIKQHFKKNHDINKKHTDDVKYLKGNYLYIINNL